MIEEAIKDLSVSIISLSKSLKNFSDLSSIEELNQVYPEDQNTEIKKYKSHYPEIYKDKNLMISLFNTELYQNLSKTLAKGRKAFDSYDLHNVYRLKAGELFKKINISQVSEEEEDLVLNIVDYSSRDYIADSACYFICLYVMANNFKIRNNRPIQDYISSWFEVLNGGGFMKKSDRQTLTMVDSDKVLSILSSPAKRIRKINCEEFPDFLNLYPENFFHVRTKKGIDNCHSLGIFKGIWLDSASRDFNGSLVRAGELSDPKFQIRSRKIEFIETLL